MISGNCNRSPQYNAMGPPGGSGGQRYGPQVFVQRQPQHHPHLLLMAGGGTRGFPQMSRGFSMMPGQGGPMINGSHPKTTVFQCTMQNGFGNGFGYHPANAGPQVFHQQQQHHLYQQPQPIHYQHHQHQHQQHPQYVPKQYIPSPPVAAHTEPTSGFINGIKNMVKGIIHPLNCDFYSDHHKYYNPKYRNNYMMDLKSDNLCYMSSPTHPKQPEPHVRAVNINLELNKPSVSEQKAKSTNQNQNESQKTREVVTIFNSEDFPALPVPRRSRSVTPPKKTETSSPPKQQEAPASAENDTESSSSPSKKHPPPKGTFFEITIRTTPSGKRPTFGGRLKVVPPPFSLNKSPRQPTNNSKSNSSANNKDCDIDEESFVIFSNNEQPGECGFSSFRRPPRQRQISECSDDSFVVFFTEDADCVNGMQHTDFDDDDDDDDDEDDDDGLDELYDSNDDSEEESSSEEEEVEDDNFCDSSENGDDDGVDVVDSSFLGRNKTDKLKCDGHALKTATTATSLLGAGPTNDHKQLDSGFEEKKVSFDPKQNVVHVMHVWNYAYRAARKGHWETIARDRDRFQERIERTSKYLNPVLTPEHREKIYRSRFCEETSNSMPPPQDSKNLKDELKSLLNRATGNCNEDSTKLPKLTKVPDCASF